MAKSFCQKHEQLKLWKHFAQSPSYDPFFRRPDRVSPTMAIPMPDVVGVVAGVVPGLAPALACSSPAAGGAVAAVVVAPPPCASSSGKRTQNGATKPITTARIANTRNTNPITRSTGTSLHMMTSSVSRAHVVADQVPVAAAKKQQSVVSVWLLACRYNANRTETAHSEAGSLTSSHPPVPPSALVQSVGRRCI